MADDDPERAAVLRAIRDDTTRSVKQTLLACLLLIAIRRRQRVTVAWSAALGATVAHYWGDLTSLVAHLSSAVFH
jgi:hypothetical protein